AVGGAIYWAPAGALMGGLLGLLAVLVHPRSRGDGRPADVGVLRLPRAVSASFTGLLAGGSVGLTAGAMLAALAAAPPGATDGAARAAVFGVLTGGLLAQLFARRVVGCQALLAEGERVELLLPARVLAVLAAAAVGAGAEWILWYQGEPAGGALYWTLAGT